jgi:plasmid maintenance system antidote protein VapI
METSRDGTSKSGDAPLSKNVPLHAPETLRWIMQHPKRGTPYTVRSLAEKAHCASATIGHLLVGRQTRTDESTAHRIAEALGCETSALFTLPPSTDLIESSADAT